MIRCIAFVAAFVLGQAGHTGSQGVDALLAPAGDASLFLEAIEAERPGFAPPPGVTGITVPHHLLAPDLMARGFWAASAGRFDRIILISPDHFRSVEGAFATVLEDFETVFGPVPLDDDAVGGLLDHPDLVERMSPEAMAGEHGIQSLTPFIRHFWPEAEIVPVVASIKTQPGDWDAMVDLLTPLIDPKTLVVQSTDYSHFLPIGDAVLRDQESISHIATADAGVVERLIQPDHLDSKAAQSIQMTLQAALGAKPVVIANRNQVEYGADDERTTSYVVTAWTQDVEAAARLRYPDQWIGYFGGDVLAGRFMSPLLDDPEALAAMTGPVRDLVAGAPLVANLEGVLLEDAPVNAPPEHHLMLRDRAGPALRMMGVTVVGLANNHSADFGPLGLDEMRRVAEAMDLSVLEHGEVADLGGARVLALNLVPSRTMQGPTADPSELGQICSIAADPPLIVFIHWGREYTNRAQEAERRAADMLADCGAVLIAGHHSHHASDKIDLVQGGMMQSVFSLGNLLFDQSRPGVSSALLEVRVFRQGTAAARLIPLPNLFVEGRKMIESLE